jgi:hypothetical protein
MLASGEIGLLSLRQGDLRRSLPLLERARTLCQDVDLPLYFPRLCQASHARVFNRLACVRG